MGDVMRSLREQLAEAEEALRLIQERKSEFVQETDVPLQLVKEERRLEAQIADLQRRLARLAEIPCPYRGLEPFEAEHAAFYFGQEAMIERLVAKVKGSAFVAVVGPSGCGKSSLVRAGLVTALSEGALPGSRDWIVRFFRPGSNPLRVLSTLLVALLEPETTEVTRMEETRKLADHLRDETLTLVDVAAQLREKRPDLPRLLILVADQFEELYTECQDEGLRQAFIRVLLSAAAENNITVALALRADFYGHALADRRLGKAVDAGLLNVLPMSEEELREVIEKPAFKTGRSFEPGLVNRMLEDVAEQPGNLPLLEFALTELWQRQTAEGAFTHAAYEAIDGVSGAIARRAKAVYEELEAQGQGETVQRIFLRLTHYGEGAEGTRRRTTLDDLVTPSTPRAAVEQTVKALADARLLVTGREEETKAAMVEVAHEALIRGWERLGRWLDQDRAFGLWRERLAVARRTWEKTQHDTGALLRGAPLSEAKGWLTGRGDDLNEAEQVFIGTSVAREKRARRLIVGGMILAFLMISIVALTFWRQRNAEQDARLEAEAAQATAVAEADVRATAQADAVLERDKAERQSAINSARELKARSLVRMDANAECALALAMEGYDRASAIPEFPRYEFEDVVRKALLETHVQATLTGHESTVNSVAWSPDGQRLASGGNDYTVRIWDTDTGENTITLTGHTDFVFTVAWSPDGQQLASASVGIWLWDAGTGEALATLTGHIDTVRAVAYSPDGRLLASASDDTTVRLWDVDTGENTATLTGHSWEVYDVAWSPDGERLASASFDGTTLLWDVNTGRAVATLESLGGQPMSITWSPDGQQLASALADGNIQIWDVDTEEDIATLTGHEAPIQSATWSPDGKWLASASEDGTIRLWNVETVENIATLTGHTDVIRSGAWSPDGLQLASAGDDGTVRLWRIEAGESVTVWMASADYVLDAAWSPDGQWLASASGFLDHDEIQLWNPDTGESTSISTYHSVSIQRIAWSPDGDRLASASADNTIHLYDAVSGEYLATLSGHTDVVYDVVWSPDGQQLASASWDRTVRLWDVNTEQNTAELTGHLNVIYSVAWSPNGQQLASTSFDNTVRLWGANTGENTLVLTNHVGPVTSVAWSPDGQQLASGASSGTIIVWDADTGEPITTLTGHTAVIWDLAWSPNGDRLASASNDETVRLWDVSTSETIATLTGHTGAVRAVTWSPDGQRLASAGILDHTIRIYYADFQQDVLPIAREQLEHGSTPEERAQCIGAP